MIKMLGTVRETKSVFLKAGWGLVRVEFIESSTLIFWGEYNHNEHVDIPMPQGPNCSNYYAVN